MQRTVIMAVAAATLFSAGCHRQFGVPTHAELVRALIDTKSDWTEKGFLRGRWPSELRALKPIKVYRHRSGLAIVLSADEQVEKGYFFRHVPKSSHQFGLPPESDAEDWSMVQLNVHLFRYSRALK